MASDALAPVPEARLRAYRAVFGLFLASQVVVFIVLASVRFLIAQEAVAGVNQILGIVSAILALGAAYAGIRARAAASADRPVDCDRRLGTALSLGALAMAPMLVQWIVLGVAPGSHYGEVFYAMSGTWLVYLLIALFVVLAARARGRRVVYTAANHWDVEAPTMFLAWSALIGVVVYVLLYVI